MRGRECTLLPTMRERVHYQRETRMLDIVPPPHDKTKGWRRTVAKRYTTKTCLVYLDDVVVFSKTFDEHVKHVQDVLHFLLRAAISLKLKKCNFFTKVVDYLGHVIKPGRLEVATMNTAAIEGFREPETQTQIRSFLGLSTVYWRFVPNFACVSALLNMLLKKEQSLKLEPFTGEERNAFKKLKEVLASPPVLRIPRENLPFSVDTDACEYQIG